MKHHLTWVKVNAPVDRGVADLVTALSRFQKLQTIESCQGDNIRGAWVCFRYGCEVPPNHKELSNFVFGFLGPGLMKRVGDIAHISVTVTTRGTARGEISIRPGAISQVATAVRQLAKEYAP